MRWWPKTPGWLATRSAKVALFGFLLNLVGLLGSVLWLEPAQQAEHDASRDALLSAARSRTLLAANAFDELANDIGGLAFGVTLPADASDATVLAVHDIRRRALLRQRDGARGYLALLGVAGAIDYPTELARFEALAAAERANLTMETYRATDAYEGHLATAMVEAQGVSAMKAITLQGDRTKAKAVVAMRNTMLLAVSLAGSTILFLATMAGVSKAAPVRPGAPRRILMLAAKRLARRLAQEGAAA